MKLPQPPPRHVQDPAPAEQAFFFRSGRSAASLADFARVLREESAATVHYHREHFAPWLRGVLGDDPLARRFESFVEVPDDATYRDLAASLAEARLAQLAALAATA